MKELEALKRLRDGYYNGYYKQFTSSEAKIDEDYNVVLKALTPPTSEEVCAKLSEYIGCDITYETHYTFVGEVEICWLIHGKVVFNIDLPPDLVGIISRFYENEVGKE